jgi:hypothetical protein
VAVAKKLADMSVIVQGWRLYFYKREVLLLTFLSFRECQIHHYREGKPPHRLSCSKPTPIVPITAETADPDPFPLYTKSPSPDLLLQVHLLQRDKQQHDYNLMLPGGTPMYRDIPPSHVKTIFLEARRKAMAEQDRTSIGVMRFILGSEYASQLEREYQVKIEDCVKAAKDHKDWDELSRYEIFTVIEDPKPTLN